MKPFRLWIYRLATWWLPETHCFAFKSIMLKWCGAKLGRNVKICSSALIMGNGGLEIGNDVWIGPGVRICPTRNATIIIDASVDIGPEVMILTGSHQIDSQGEHLVGKGLAKSVKIGKGCWLCARVLILPGVELPPKNLVAAGAVVVKSSLHNGVLLAGVPAKVVREI